MCVCVVICVNYAYEMCRFSWFVIFIGLEFLETLNTSYEVASMPPLYYIYDLIDLSFLQQERVWLFPFFALSLVARLVLG